MSDADPLVRRMIAARGDAATADPGWLAALAEQLAAAVDSASAELGPLRVDLTPEGPWDLLMEGAAPGWTATERGAAALQAWQEVVGDRPEWHAAWTDGPVLTLDAVLRTSGAPEAQAATVRLVLGPG